MDAFISHSSSDARLAGRIEQTLEENGLKVWLDRSEIRLGRLLRNELQTAIRESRVIILLWSAVAAKSRWVAAEVLTAFHLNRFIIACASDKTALPYFLQSTIYLNLQPRKSGWVDELRRAIREAPSSANDILPRMGSETPQLVETVRQLAEGQLAVTDRIGNDLAGAKKYQAVAARELRAAEKKWRMEAMILNLAGYHRKNAYMLKHWPAIMAGRPPKDPLLDRAGHYFYESLFVDPNNYSALNGLGSILFYERELDAAEFVIRRAILLAETAGVNYPAAQHDLQLVQTFKARNLN
jgi:TIR domain-containing protein